MRHFSSKKSEVALFIKQFSLRLTWSFRIAWEVIFDPRLIPNEISCFPKAFYWCIQKDRPVQSLLTRNFSALKKFLQYQALPVTSLSLNRSELNSSGPWDPWAWIWGRWFIPASPLLYVFYWRGGWDGPAEIWLCAVLLGWWLQTSSCG